MTCKACKDCKWFKWFTHVTEIDNYSSCKWKDFTHAYASACIMGEDEKSEDQEEVPIKKLN